MAVSSGLTGCGGISYQRVSDPFLADFLARRRVAAIHRVRIWTRRYHDEPLE